MASWARSARDFVKLVSTASWQANTMPGATRPMAALIPATISTMAHLRCIDLKTENCQWRDRLRVQVVGVIFYKATLFWVVHFEEDHREMNFREGHKLEAERRS